MAMVRARSSPVSTLVSRTTGIDAPAFAAAFDALSAPRMTWNAPDDALVFASGAAATLTASGPDRFAAIRSGADDLFDSGDVHAGTEAARPRLFGGFAFHEGGCDGDPWEPFPEARFVLPRVQVTFADNGAWLTVNAVGDDADPDAVEERLAAERDRIAGKYPDCHRYYFEPDAEGSAFFGATPERLVALRGRTVETDALAGTTGRGETPAEDEWLAQELLDDAKNVHEHELVADTVREQLEPFAASISAGERRVRRLATVQHLHTPITAELNADRHVLDLVEALHPTPAVGGLPPDRALETIHDTEPFDRGWYAAPVGWIDAAGNGAFAVAIRSAVATQSRATLFAGVGLVADSDPDREWDEVQLKYRPILDELEGGS